MRIPVFILAVAVTAFAVTHQEIITADKPVAYWQFDDSLDCCAQEAGFQHELKAERSEHVSLSESGPRGPKFPGFEDSNLAADFTSAGGPAFMRVKDPGARSVFDFAKGETLTAEAWVRCDGLKDGQQVYIVGKGSWAMRLRGGRAEGKPVAAVGFLFRDEKNAGEESWHRWTSAHGFTPGEEWHHVAVTYTFGKPDSAKAWINGTEVGGVWDMGGATELGPIQDDDDVWIGSGMGGKEDVQFPGRIDELAIYRTALSTEKMAARARRTGPPPALTRIAHR